MSVAKTLWMWRWIFSHADLTQKNPSSSSNPTWRKSVSYTHLDLLLAQTQPGYLPLLQRYMHTVRARNALLKQSRQGGTDEGALESFSAELVRFGNEIIRARRELAPKFSPLARLAYRRI